eukprot:2303829-Amphidinium_carterae.1
MAYGACVEQWLAESADALQNAGHPQHLILQHPSGELVQGALSGYADDTLIKRLVLDGDPRSAACLVQLDDKVFDACMADGGYCQHVDKKDLVPCLLRSQANK